LLRHARALLFPIDWEEPFGMVMIEALACGTPVVAFRRGAVPEVVEEGVSGFVVDDVDGAVRALDRLGELDRARCRGAFDARFTATRMAHDYLHVYRALAGGDHDPDHDDNEQGSPRSDAIARAGALPE
jgi:glycosyltransferase involved in cell wall biosynthesis